MLNRGFVFGKFYPFHLGHRAMITFALNHCQHLDVVVCCSNTEAIPSADRAGWIKAEFANNPRINVIELNYDESSLPNSSVANKGISQQWAGEFKRLLPTTELLVTSEPYGDYVAKYMGITHIPFDAARASVPISASVIRANILAHWRYLPAAVQRYFQKTLVVSGTESTGKTLFCNHLVATLPTVLVDEVGRELIKNSKKFALKDLYAIAEAHANNIASCAQSLAPLVVIDTDVYVTQSYAQYMFGGYLNLPASIYKVNNADIRIFMDKQAPYVQDGTRLDKPERDRLEQFHLRALSDFKQNHILVSGAAWDERTQKAMAVIADSFNCF